MVKVFNYDRERTQALEILNIMECLKPLTNYTNKVKTI